MSQTTPPHEDSIPGWLHATFVGSSVAMLVLFGVAIVREINRPATLEQRIVEPLGVVDRCESCHDPAKHSGTALTNHPIERFGCTPCHGGQGLATDKRSAHEAQPDWERPLFSNAEREAACGTCHADAPTGLDRLARGRRAIAERGCSGCHEVPGVGPPDFAPALDGLAAKVGPAWVRAWLIDPKPLNEAHRMPRFSLDPDQVEALVAFLLSTPKPTLDALEGEGDAERGREAVATRRCATCHLVGGRGGTLGPSLDAAGAKLDPTWLYNYLRDVHRLRPTSRMPGFKLPAAEAADIVAYAKEELVPDEAELPWAKHAGPVDEKLAPRGKELFVELGCRGCHELQGLPFSRASVSLTVFGDRRATELFPASSGPRLTDVPSWVAKKVLEPRAFEVAGAQRAVMPAFAMPAEEAEAIGIAIGALKPERVPAPWKRGAERGKARLPTGETLRLVDRYRCLVCHRVGDTGGDVSKVPLDGVASRLARPWLDEFLRSPLTVRMEQAERMPVLGIEPAEATRLANWLESSLADERIGEPPAPTDEEAARGKGLYRKHGCAGCHVAEGEGEIKAPVLDGANRRLKFAYVLALLEQGSKLAPEGRHPAEVHPSKEARAMAAYVMSLPPPATESEKTTKKP